MKPERSVILRGIARNVLVFGIVSFLTDVSSEMIYPLLPLFLTSVLGAGPAYLGIIEGAAESIASFLKLGSGIISDRVSVRKPLVLAGYTISSIARPLVAVATTPFQVLAVRCSDRVGKGVRTSPRDALIADSTPPETRGRAFGFHRSMDHAGAIVGPLVASLMIAGFGAGLRTVFWLAAVPGLLAVATIVVGVREVPRLRSQNGRFLLVSPTGPLRRYLFILVLFTLGNSSDAFLLLRAGQLGVSPARIPLLWVFFHVVKMTSSLPLGVLSDRVGRRRVIVSGWVVYALAYVGFALARTEGEIWGLFALYGLFYGFTEGVEKAFLTDITPPVERGAAFGWYHFAVGIAALPASILFGIIWQHVNAQAAFCFGATLAALASLLLLLLLSDLPTSLLPTR